MCQQSIIFNNMYIPYHTRSFCLLKLLWNRTLIPYCSLPPVVWKGRQLRRAGLNTAPPDLIRCGMSSVVGPNTLNLDPNPEIWSILEPDPSHFILLNDKFWRRKNYLIYFLNQLFFRQKLYFETSLF